LSVFINWCGESVIRGLKGAAMIRALTLFLAAALAPAVWAEPLTYTMLSEGIRAADPAIQPPPHTIGSGRYAYRFALRDPHTGLPWPNRAYALSLTRPERRTLPFVRDEKGVYQGTTDEAGKTSVFRLPFRVADQHWDIRERFGEGPYGETFKLVTSHPEQPLENMHYAISVCSDPIRTFQGYSGADGKTGYVASQRPEQLELRIGFDLTEIVAGGCGDATPVAAVEEPATALSPESPAKARLQTLMQDGETALKASDYVKAHALFAQADALFGDASAELPSPSNLIRHAAIKYYAALASGGGKLGSLCPELNQARQLAETARDRSRASTEADVLAVANSFLSDVDKQASLYKCGGATDQSAQQTLVGHYYLSGISEVGSELRLRPDARFEWMLAYGSMDQSASGTWRVDGTTLILSTDRPDTSAPLAVLGAFTPWDVDAENAMRRKTLDATEAAIAARCPFLANVYPVALSPRLYFDDAGREAAKAAAVKEIAAVVERERASRARAEIAAAAAMSASTDKADAMANANTALTAWQKDDADVYDVHNRAGLQRPRRETPRLPAACIMPMFVEADSEINTDWARGRGIQVRFADQELSARPMDVVFHFRQAADLKVTSDRDGYALLPVGAAQAWTRVSLVIPTPNGPRTVTLPVSPPQPTGIQAILLNEKALVAPPFETMRLTISGNELRPEDQFAGGKYSRQ
jgi:hypothetical protein